MSIAFEIARRGENVTCIFEPEDDDRAASFAAGAMLGAFAEITDDRNSIADKLETEFRVVSARMYKNFILQLAEIHGNLVEVRPGTFIIANPAGKDDVRNIDRIKIVADEFHEPNEWVKPENIPGYKPHRFLQASKALFLPEENSLNATELVTAIRRAADTTGRVTWLHHRVNRILLKT